MYFYLELGVDRVENISIYHTAMSIIVNKHCWEVIFFNQSLAGWETALITVQMKSLADFCRRWHELKSWLNGVTKGVQASLKVKMDSRTLKTCCVGIFS